jgi:hypothetical protein
MVWASTKEQDDSEYNQTDDGEDLQSRKPELGFSVERNGKHVKGEDCCSMLAHPLKEGNWLHTNEDNRNPEADVDRRIPVFDDQTRSSDF